MAHTSLNTPNGTISVFKDTPDSAHEPLPPSSNAQKIAPSGSTSNTPTTPFPSSRPRTRQGPDAASGVAYAEYDTNDLEHSEDRAVGFEYTDDTVSKPEHGHDAVSEPDHAENGASEPRYVEDGAADREHIQDDASTCVTSNLDSRARRARREY
jgi:hypothetical protein